MSSKDRKKMHKGKIYPDADDDGTDFSYSNAGMEMERQKSEEKRSSDKNLTNTSERLKSVAKRAQLKKNALQIIASAKTGAVSKWRKYVTTRRKFSDTNDGALDRRKTGGIGLEYDMNLNSTSPKEKSNGKKSGADSMDGVKGVHMQMIVTHNRNLIEYFARLGQSKDSDEAVNLEYLESILKAGANINCTDKYGQSILHEVARAWHVDVAKFLILNLADVNQADNYGRTALHVAAAVDYPEMVNYLVSKGADKEAITKGEHQTPVHFAARNDACMSLKALIKNGCLYKDVRDYKGRTPIHVAAELDRSETTRFLLELDDPAPAGVEDESGQAAITWMISKMPPVAKLALDQFHTKDRANRKQAYYLNRLEPRKPKTEVVGYPQTPMQVVVRFRRFDLIEHPIVLTLIRDKWKNYGRLGAVINTIINCVFILLWTVQGVLVEYDVRYNYQMPSQWWRIVLFLAAIGFTAWQLKDELAEYIQSRKMHNKWKQWRSDEIDKDLKYTHPRWPEESRYLLSEKDLLDQQRPQYFNDFWNVFDWICYALLLVCIVTHLVDVIYHTNFIARLHIRIMAVTVIVIWIRLLKNARAFSYLGPFIVMLTHMLSDVIRFGFLYLEFFFPFACAFWMLFGGTKVPETYQGLPDASNHTMTVNGMGTVDALLFTLFRITLVDDYDYDGFKSVDSIMADIIIGSWLALSAILMLNLLIALLSDTFQRVYDNAQANAVMQKAITILGIEDGLNKKRREKFRTYIHSSCSPKEEDYDDDEVQAGGEDLQKVTIQIKEQLDDMESKLEHGYYDRRAKRVGSLGVGDSRHRLDSVNSNVSAMTNQSTAGDEDCVTKKVFSSEMTTLRGEMEEIRSAQTHILDRFKKDMRSVKDLLQQIAAQAYTEAPLSPGDGLNHYHDYSGRLTRSMPLEGPPPMYSSYTSLPQGRPPIPPPTIHHDHGRPPIPPLALHRDRSPQSHTSRESRPLDQEWVILERQRAHDLQQLRESLAHRGGQNSSRTTDDQHTDGTVLSGSQLVVEVSEQNVRPVAPPPPPYRSDTDTQAPRDDTNC